MAAQGFSGFFDRPLRRTPQNDSFVGMAAIAHEDVILSAAKNPDGAGVEGMLKV